MGAIKKVRRCKFCRSKAKYLPGQRSLDAVSAKIFRRKKTPESNRRAASEDRYCTLPCVYHLSYANTGRGHITVKRVFTDMRTSCVTVCVRIVVQLV